MTGCTPALSTREHHRLADVIFSAAAAGRPLVPLTVLYPELTDADASRIRDLVLERRIADGEQLIGAKVSLGDAAAVPGDGVLEPRLAWLTDGMLLGEAVADVSGFANPRVEPKLAFRLGRQLRGALPTVSELLAATERVMPCLDVVDSRFDAYGPRLADHVAENGATALLVVGDGVPPPADGHLRRVRVQLRVDGPALEPERDPGRRMPVPPIEAVSWLGGRLVAKSLTPGPGTLLVSHPIGGAIDLGPGVRVIAHFTGLGTVQLDT
jgi:2-keto-4-pentenoate hydratase